MKPLTPQATYRVKGTFMQVPTGKRAKKILEDLKKPALRWTPKDGEKS